MSSQSATTAQFSSLRRFLWPIHRHEVKKFLPMTLIMFCVLFNYTLLRNMKDALVITASGPEVLPFLKAFVILPFSLVIVALYAKISNLFERETVFYIVISFFLFVYISYALFIHPNTDTLHMSAETLNDLKKAYPNFQHLFSVVGNWSSSLFYLFAELWGATIISLMFWQFANATTRIVEAKRFYTMFGLLGHLALPVAGWFGSFLCKLNHDTPTAKTDGWTDYLNYNIMAITISAIIAISAYRWIQVNIINNPEFSNHDDVIGTKKEKKTKLSLAETIRYISQSKYLGYILMMVIGYGLSMNLSGILWKKQVQIAHPDPLDYADFLGKFVQWVGVMTMCFILFLKGMVERFGWYRAAIFTPVIVLTTVIPFFTFMFFSEELAPLCSLAGCTAITLAVVIGGAQQIISKGAKYSLFDPTKEMAYIPLDQELKIKGKAAIDVSGYSFAKASGGYIAGGLLVVSAASDLMVIAPYLAAIVILVVILWLVCVKRLSILYRNLISKAKSRSVETFTGSDKVIR